jgi:acyl carrier protein
MEFEKLCGIIAKVLRVDAREITGNASFAKDLGADSIDMAQILIGIREEFQVALPETEIVHMQKVSDAVKLIQEAKR